MKRIPYGRQHITDEDIQEVVAVLKADYLTQGPRIAEFEKAFADYIGAKYAVSVSNGTAALHLGVLALGLKEGEKVITTPITFVASANCVRYVGGEVVFADIDPETYLLDIKTVEKLLKASPKGTYKGIIPVDFAGRAVDMEAFRNLADEYGCWIIEDACHAPGGSFVDSKGTAHNCGNGDFAELAVFSFHPVKHIATGEGGMITTNDEKLYRKLKNLRTHGIQQDQALWRENHGLWYYEMQELGFNYRLSDMQCALGTSQLKRAVKGMERRCEIVEMYANYFKDKPYVKRQTGVVQGHAYHLYVLEFERRTELYDHLLANNIIVQVHYIPAHLMPYYRDLGWKEGSLPAAEQYYKDCLSLPIFPTLSNEEQNYVIEKIEEFYAK